MRKVEIFKISVIKIHDRSHWQGLVFFSINMNVEWEMPCLCFEKAFGRWYSSLKITGFENRI